MRSGGFLERIEHASRARAHEAAIRAGLEEEETLAKVIRNPLLGEGQAAEELAVTP